MSLVVPSVTVGPGESELEGTVDGGLDDVETDDSGPQSENESLVEPAA